MCFSVREGRLQRALVTSRNLGSQDDDLWLQTSHGQCGCGLQRGGREQKRGRGKARSGLPVEYRWPQAGHQNIQRKQKLKDQVYAERVKQQLKLFGPNRTKQSTAGGKGIRPNDNCS